MSTKKGRLLEVLRFAVSGGVCFLIELAVLMLLRDKVGLDTLIATPIAFLISVAVNYLLCVRWVFQGAAEQKRAAKIGFLITSAAGLALNELFMFLFRLMLGEEAVLLTVAGFSLRMVMVNKAMATLLVMIWNYFTKRLILRRGQQPTTEKGTDAGNE